MTLKRAFAKPQCPCVKQFSPDCHAAHCESIEMSAVKVSHWLLIGLGEKHYYHKTLIQILEHVFDCFVYFVA